MPLVDLLVRAGTTFLALLFVMALVHKSSEFGRFTGFVAQYRMLPAGMETPFSVALIAAEAAAVAAMVAAPTQPAGLRAVAALLLLYALAVGLNVWRGRTHIDCGCGGPAQPISFSLVVRNILLAAMALALSWPDAGSLATSDTLMAVLAGALLWLTWMLVAKVLGHFRGTVDGGRNALSLRDA